MRVKCLSLMPCFVSSISKNFFGFWSISGSAQGLLLGLYSGIIPSGAWETHIGCWGSNLGQVPCKASALCGTVALAHSTFF